MRRSTRENSHEHIASYLLPANARRAWRPYSSLHFKRAGSSLARSAVLHLLPDHWPRLLVALYVLACGYRRRGAGGAPLASLGLPRPSFFPGLGVENWGPGHGE